MKVHQTSCHSRYRWLEKPLLGYSYHSWLIEKGSLTAKLQERYHQFSVKPIVVEYKKPNQDEARLLHSASRDVALIREVLLYGNGKPVVFAHSVMPRKGLRGAWRGLDRLGDKPLGATLFANSKAKRTPLNYKKLYPTHVLYQRATRHLVDKPAFLWARRSVFSLNCANIMVIEVFLPSLILKF